MPRGSHQGSIAIRSRSRNRFVSAVISSRSSGPPGPHDTATSWNRSSSASLEAIRPRPGNSRRHGGHHVPQKLRSVTRPVNVGAGRPGSRIATSGTLPTRLPTAGWGVCGPTHPAPRRIARKDPARTPRTSRAGRPRSASIMRAERKEGWGPPVPAVVTPADGEPKRGVP